MSLRSSLTKIRTPPGPFGAREALVLTLHHGELIAHGEAAPLPPSSQESLELAESTLRAITWNDVDPESDDPLSLAEALVPIEVSSARFAVETALLDLTARGRDKPLCALLTDLEPAASVRTSLTFDGVASALTHAADAGRTGVTAIEVRIESGERADEEARLLRSLRDVLGDHIRIRIDMRGRFQDPDQVLMGAFVDIDVDLLIEPCSIETLMSEQPLPVPVAIDESMSQQPLRALRAIEMRRAEALVLRPTLIGGIGRSLALAEAARQRGGRAIVRHLFEPPRAFAACAHLALAIGADEVHSLARYPGIDQWRDPQGREIAVASWINALRIERPSDAGLAP